MRTIRTIIMTALVGASVGSISPGFADAVNDRINELDQKTRILERKLEIADEAAATKAKESASVTAGSKGFALTSADKTYALKLRGYVQADSRNFIDDSDESFSDTFLIRRARVIFDVDLGPLFSGRISPEFGGGSTQLQDGYVDFKPSKALNLRIGRTKVPFGLERLQSSSDTLFNETAFTTALTPNYDQGVSTYGSFSDGVVEYALGVFNGGPDGASIDSDTNDDKDLAARLWFSPFKNGDVNGLDGLSFGIAGTFGKQSGTTNAPGLPSFRTSGQNTFYSYRTSTNSAQTAFADGDRTRLSPQLYYAVGSLGLLSELVISEQDVANGKGTQSVKNEAWQLAASYVLTGETPSLKGVDPKNEFGLGAGGWGAFELIARISEIEFDETAFSAGYAQSTRSATAAQNWGVGLNWYLTRNTKFALNYETTTFDDGAAKGDRADENLLLARAQLKF